MRNPQPGDGQERTAEALEQAAILTLRHLVDRGGLTATAYQALSRLHREGPVRLTVLAAAEGISQPSTTQLIQRLERNGLATRINDPEDGRVALVDITESGREFLARDVRGRRARLAELLATLPPEDETTLRLAMHVALPILQQLVRTAAEPNPAVQQDLQRHLDRAIEPAGGVR